MLFTARVELHNLIRGPFCNVCNVLLSCFSKEKCHCWALFLTDFFKHQLMLANVMKQIFIFIYIWVKAVRGAWGNDTHGQGAKGQKGLCFCSATEESWIIPLKGV